MNVKGVIIYLILTAPVSLADSATQTDWSGGAGMLGPVTEWSNQFYECSNIDYSTSTEITFLSFLPTEHVVDANFDGVLSVCLADINDDGYMDVLGAAEFDGDITWWENTDGTGTAWTEHTIDANFISANSVHSADINDDGYMDVLGSGGSDITWWENEDGSGTVWTEHTIDANLNAAKSVHTADINGDGYMDVLGASRIDDDIIWWANTDGSGTVWVKYTIDGDFNWASSVYSGDINGDGHMDVVGAAQIDDDITWWENSNGFGSIWEEHTIDADFDGACSVCLVDINDDGYLDVLGAAHYDDEITWWENTDGTGTVWTEHTIDANFDCANSVHSADINDDGYMDVLGAALITEEIVVWENTDGSGTTWNKYTIADSIGGAYSVHSADIDGDGYLDVLGSANYDDDIIWWHLGTTGSLVSSILFIETTEVFWNYFSWNSTEPIENAVDFQIRASDDPYAMGDWSSQITEPCSLSSILNDGDKFFQYKVNFETLGFIFNTVVDDVTVEWATSVEIEQESEVSIGDFVLHDVIPNPAYGHATLAFSLPFETEVNLIIYDITGRIVYSLNQDFSAGTHEVEVNGLASGLYLIQITSEDSTVTGNFVMLE